MELALDLPWTRVSERVAREIGLYFPPERHADLRKGVAAAAGPWGLATEAQCVEQILSPRFSKANAVELARHLTVGETYFFRDAKTFDALSQRVLPALIEQRRRTRTFQLWSAACCTGQETYSLAILLDQLLPDLEEWNINLFGTDINPLFLEKAAAGIYGEWSFRETPDWFKLRYFERVSDKEWAILPRYKSLAKFMPLNLVEEEFPFPFNTKAAMDVILCRNVLMYFDLPRARKVVSHLRKVIREDGWLVAGPSEGAQVMANHFVPVNYPGAILYKPANGEQVRSGVAPEIELPAVPTPQVEHLSAPPPTPVSFATEAMACADAGDLVASLGWCDRWLEAEKLNPAAHYLRAVVLQESGDTRGARQSLQRALYLDPRHVLAHFTLATLARTTGDEQEATRYFNNTLELLRSYPPDEALPESGGITAARLQEIIHSTR